MSGQPTKQPPAATAEPEEVPGAQVVITIQEPEPGQIGMQVQGPDNLFLTLGIIEFAKAKLLADEQQRKPGRIVKPPAGLAQMLRRRGKGKGKA